MWAKDDANAPSSSSVPSSPSSSSRSLSDDKGRSSGSDDRSSRRDYTTTSTASSPHGSFASYPASSNAYSSYGTSPHGTNTNGYSSSYTSSSPSPSSLSSASASAAVAGSDDPTNLYISGLPPTYEKREIDAIFAPYGKIVNSRVLLDESGQSKCVGFVRFDTEDHAASALASLNRAVIVFGQPCIEVRYAKRTGTGAMVSPMARAPHHGAHGGHGHGHYGAPMASSSSFDHRSGSSGGGGRSSMPPMASSNNRATNGYHRDARDDRDRSGHDRHNMDRPQRPPASSPTNGHHGHGHGHSHASSLDNSDLPQGAPVRTSSSSTRFTPYS